MQPKWAFNNSNTYAKIFFLVCKCTKYKNSMILFPHGSFSVLHAKRLTFPVYSLSLYSTRKFHVDITNLRIIFLGIIIFPTQSETILRDFWRFFFTPLLMDTYLLRFTRMYFEFVIFLIAMRTKGNQTASKSYRNSWSFLWFT